MISALITILEVGGLLGVFILFIWAMSAIMNKYL